jgi:Glycosyl hydrolase family 63 C-terminal domain
MEWFLSHRRELAQHVIYKEKDGEGNYLLAIPSKDRLMRALHHVLDEQQFLSPFGLRSLSKVHQEYPYIFRVGSEEYRVDYTPGDSNTAFFGGNSNWRGPIWFPINYLFIEALERFHYFYQDDLLVEFPTHSGNKVPLASVAQALSLRLTHLFRQSSSGDNVRACHSGDALYRDKDDWKDLLLFYEYFHGETGKGLGASHQTGWTSLVTRCFEKVL